MFVGLGDGLEPASLRVLFIGPKISGDAEREAFSSDLFESNKGPRCPKLSPYLSGKTFRPISKR